MGKLESSLRAPDCSEETCLTRPISFRFKPPELGIQQVTASTVEIHDDHLVFCDTNGQLTTLFLFKIVQSWNALSK
jgi:hypothetical protein